MEKARVWLENNGSYSEGVKLLEALGGKIADYTPYLTTMLVPPAAKQKLREAVESRLPNIIAQPITANEPEVVFQYRNIGRRLLKQQADLHSKMKVAATDTERYLLAEQLMEEVIPEIDRVYDAIRDYEQHHVVPPPPEMDAVRVAASKLMKVKYLSDRISRLRRWIDTGAKDKQPLTEAEKAGFKEEITEKEAALEALRIELGLKNQGDENTYQAE